MSRVSLRTWLILVAVGAALVASAALIAVGYRVNAVEISDALRRRAVGVARRFDHVVADRPTSDYELQATVDRLLKEGSLVGAVVFSPAREVQAYAPSTSVLNPAMSEWPEGVGAIRNVVVGGVDASAVAAALDNGGRCWIAFDRAPYAAAESRLQRMWAVITGAAVAVALLAALLIGGVLSRRLREIAATVERVRDGDLEARCAERGPIEVAALARGVNETALKLARTMQELGHERSALEQQVTGRTRELEQANRLLMDIANRDALTGLANRRRLEIELERNISFSKRTGQPLAVIMMDLDKFKICNDTAGHLVGDNILRAVAATLRSRVRVTDLVVRWGGDEFCILVPATQPQGAVAAAESLVDAVREATSAVPLPEPLEPPTASAGVACFPEDGEDPHTLILNADAALYQVKATGRGRVLRYSSGFSRH